MKVYTVNDKFFMDDNGIVTELFVKPGQNWLNLPENSCGRKFTNLSKLEKHGGEIDYGTDFKEPRHIAVGERAPRKPREEWLDGNDLAEYRRLNALIDERIAASKQKPMSKADKLKADMRDAYDKILAMGGDPKAILGENLLKVLGIEG